QDGTPPPVSIPLEDTAKPGPTRGGGAACPGSAMRRRGSGAPPRLGTSAPVEDAPARLAHRERFLGVRRGRRRERDEAPLTDAFPHHRDRPTVALQGALVVVDPAPLDALEQARARAVE